MRFYFLPVFFLFLAPLASADLIINEIMYNPIEDDNYNEWIEIYNSGAGAESLENWSICDKKILSGYVDRNETVHLNYSLKIPSGAYAIITDGGSGTEAYEHFNISADSIAAHVDASSLCGGSLPNTNEKSIILKDASGTMIENITYFPLWGANGNGKTLERNASEWLESNTLGGTPGQENSILSFENPAEQNNETLADEPNPANRSALQESVPENGASSIEIIRIPPLMKFGDFAGIQARFYPGERNFSKMHFVAYIFSPSWIARDMARDEETIRSAPYNSAAAIEISGVAKNMTQNILLPIYLKCKENYAEGSYIVRVRGYSFDTAWNEVAEKDAQISVSGENDLCKTEKCENKIVYVNKTIKEPCMSGTPAKIAANEDALQINATVPDEVFIKENFTTEILLKNNGNATLDIEIYSYIYEHSAIMSQGWTGDKWGNARASNSKKAILLPNESTEVELINMPRENIAPEKYTFKVRVDDLNDVKKSEERVFLIEVKASPETGNLNVEIKNNSGNISENKITGAMLAKSSGSSQDSFWQRIIAVIRRLFK